MHSCAGREEGLCSLPVLGAATTQRHLSRHGHPVPTGLGLPCDSLGWWQSDIVAWLCLLSVLKGFFYVIGDDIMS